MEDARGPDCLHIDSCLTVGWMGQKLQRSMNESKIKRGDISSSPVVVVCLLFVWLFVSVLLFVQGDGSEYSYLIVI